MKKMLLKPLALLVGLGMATSALAVDTVTPTWYVNSSGQLNGTGTAVSWWNGTPTQNQGMVGIGLGASYLYVWGGNGTSSTDMKKTRIKRTTGALQETTTIPSSSANLGTYPITYLFNIDGKICASNFAGQLRIYNVTGGDATCTQVGTFLNKNAAGNTVGVGEVTTVSVVGTKKRIAFACAGQTEITYLECTSISDIDFANVKRISLTKDSKAYTVPGESNSARSRVDVRFLSDGSFFVNTNGCTPQYFNKSGVWQGEFSSELTDNFNIGTGIDIIEEGGKKYAIVVKGEKRDALHKGYLIDFTPGVDKATRVAVFDPNFTPSTTVDGAFQKNSICKATTYNENTGIIALQLWVLQPVRGLSYFKYDINTLPPFELDKTEWTNTDAKGDYQRTRVTYSTRQASAKHIVSYKTGTDTWKTLKTIDINSNPSAAWVATPMGTGSQITYRFQSFDASDNVLCTEYDYGWNIPFGELSLKAGKQDNDVFLAWQKETGGEPTNFKVQQIVGGEATTIVTLTPDANQYIVKNAPDGATYRVVADMKQTLTLPDPTNASSTTGVTTSQLESNTVTPAALVAPELQLATTYKGRTTSTLVWTEPKTTGFFLSHYKVYRDGVRVSPKIECAKFTDMNLPDGTFTYKITAVYYLLDANKNYVLGADGNPMEFTVDSNTKTITIQRNHLVTGYGLEVVYNYPIMTRAEMTAAGLNQNQVVLAEGIFSNAKDKVGSYGAPGDAYRQAQFYNGNWYLACLTTKGAIWHDANSNPVAEGTTDATFNIPNAWNATELTKNFGTDKAGIIKVADPRTLSTVAWNTACVQETWPLENQSIAIDGNGRIYRRQIGSLFNNKNLSNSGADCGLFYLPWPGLRTTSGSDIKDITTPHAEWYTEFAKGSQRYRTHYISAYNTADNAYVLMAMNFTRDLKVVDLNGNIRHLTAPQPANMGASSSTENYAFPIESRPGQFIHTVRGEGTYHVAADGTYTPIYQLGTDVANSGGCTFIYNEEFFVVHPTSTHSNNVGHFAVDMADRKDGTYTANNVPLTSMIPVAAYAQEGLSNFEAGNSNANWFGAEVSEADNCVYIYQYVPGVRFAKYRLYSYNQFPGVQPELDVQVVEAARDNGAHHVTGVTATINWKRPSQELYKPADSHTEYLVDYYTVELHDAMNNLVKSWTQNVPEGSDTDANTTYTLKYETNAAGVMDLREGKYTVSVKPVFVKKSNHDIHVDGEGGTAVSKDVYPASIDNMRAKAYKHTTQNIWAVELDFDRASFNNYPQHVSYFTLEVSADGGKTWQQIQNFTYTWAANYQGHSSETYEQHHSGTVQHVIGGDYLFGVEGEQNMKTRTEWFPSKNKAQAKYAAADGMTSFKQILIPESSQPAVAKYNTTTDPSSNLYRATAHYGATNPYVYKTVSTQAVAPTNGGTSGLGELTAGEGTALKLYPVPATTTVTVESSEDIQSVVIFSLAGTQVLSEQGNGTPMQQVSVSHLPAGVYMLQVNNQTPVRLIKR